VVGGKIHFLTSAPASASSKKKPCNSVSPFDYASQATLYVEVDLPEPGDVLRFMPIACEKIVHYLEQTNGGAFVLFTSYAMLIDAANRLKGRP